MAEHAPRIEVARLAQQHVGLVVVLEARLGACREGPPQGHLAAAAEAHHEVGPVDRRCVAAGVRAHVVAAGGLDPIESLQEVLLLAPEGALSGIGIVPWLLARRNGARHLLWRAHTRPTNEKGLAAFDQAGKACRVGDGDGQLRRRARQVGARKAAAIGERLRREALHARWHTNSSPTDEGGRADASESRGWTNGREHIF